MTNDDMPVDEEHLESIPWSSLLPQAQHRPWLTYVAAGAVVALVVGVLAARSLRTAAPAADPVPVSSTVPPPTVPTTSAPISEADLRADIQPAEAGASAATMRAEWFVTDYFTRDGAGGLEAELAGALGRQPPFVGPEVITYVEWARGWETVHEGDGRYRVSVAFRSITATGDGFVRGLVHGVAVRVQVDTTGGTRVIELPEPLELAAAPTLADLPAPESVPDGIAERALRSAMVWGEDATIIEGTLDAGTWRVLVEVADEHETVWPLVVWVEEGA